jgi:hypothetical protein
MVWLVEHLLVIYLKEDDFNYPPLEKVEPNRKYIKTFDSTFRKGGVLRKTITNYYIP